LVHGSLSSHTLLLTVPQRPVKGSQTLNPHGPLGALQVTGLEGKQVHFPFTTVGVTVAHLLIGQGKLVMAQDPFSQV